MAKANNNESSKKTLNREYTDFMYSLYMKNYWLIQVGYRSDPKSVIEKTLMDWKEESDCNNNLCTRAQSSGVLPETYMSLQDFSRGSIYTPLCAHPKGKQYNCSAGDCNIYYGNCGCGYTYNNCCANAPYNLTYNSPFVIWN